MKIKIGFNIDDDASEEEKQTIVRELKVAWQESSVASWDWDCEVKA